MYEEIIQKLNSGKRAEALAELAFHYLEKNKNPDQAYICLQQACLYADGEDMQAEIERSIGLLRDSYSISVRNTAIIIAARNACYMQEKNIESIRATLPKGSYSIYVVDNASEDGVTDYLRSQEDVCLLINEKNEGFARACNQGVAQALTQGDGDSDIFLLNNDTRLSELSLFWLRMALYENEGIGAAGSLSNYAGNEQQLELSFDLPQDYVDYGSGMNIPMEYAYEERVRLSGFALLVKRDAWDRSGGMDEAFTPGYFEDDDLCMRISRLGYRLVLCKNSFIYHAGSQSFAGDSHVNEYLTEHRRLFMEKYGFDIISYAKPHYDIIAEIPAKNRAAMFNCLVVGSGLGADIKYLKYLYPNARMVGLEKRSVFTDIMGRTETVFDSVEALKGAVSGRVFDLVIFPREEAAVYTREEFDLLRELCRENAILLQGKNRQVSFEKVKLIIWDLDDTFWRGTLSEGEVRLEPQLLQLVREITDCGIICSISSKNNEEDVKKVLSENGIEDYFVFNNINFLPKGSQIKQKLADMRLRAENVLFLDDNPRNLSEAAYENMGLMTAGPELIPEIAKYINSIPKADKEHKRLEQYRILEKKREKMSQAQSSEEFLYDSNIEVTIGHSCKKEADRIYELMQRSNQLNFTKLRSSRQELEELLDSGAYDCGYVRVRDRYGDYGIAGFYCLDRAKNGLLHFFFSCRIMGMGVEGFLYDHLKKPELSIAEPVAGDISLKGEWISLKEEESTAAAAKADENVKAAAGRKRLLLKGPCDLSAMEDFIAAGLGSSWDIKNEFNYVNSLGHITAGQNHLIHIFESQEMTAEQLRAELSGLPFLSMGDFETDMFTGAYDTIVLSLLPSAHAGVYQNRESGFLISFGSRNFDLTKEENWQGLMDGSIVNHNVSFSLEILKCFQEKWEMLPEKGMPMDMFMESLEYVYEKLREKSRLILLLGSELECIDGSREFAGHGSVHREMNRLAEDFVRDRRGICCIKASDYISSQEDFTDSTNHYSRAVYYKLSQAVAAAIEDEEW